MRVTVNDLMSNPELQRKFQSVNVLVDGIQHNHVIVADQEQGYIEKFQQDEGGGIVLNAERDGALTEIIKGKVEFIHRIDKP